MTKRFAVFLRGSPNDRLCEAFRMPAMTSPSPRRIGRRPKCTKARSRGVWGTDSAAGATCWRRPRWKAWRQREAMWELSAVGISSGTRSASTGGWRTRHGVESQQPASQNACTTFAFWHEGCSRGDLMFPACVISNSCGWQKWHTRQPLRD
jgi:hypothetical protein